MEYFLSDWNVICVNEMSFVWLECSLCKWNIFCLFGMLCVNEMFFVWLECYMCKWNVFCLIVFCLQMVYFLSEWNVSCVNWLFSLWKDCSWSKWNVIHVNWLFVLNVTIDNWQLFVLLLNYFFHVNSLLYFQIDFSVSIRNVICMLSIGQRSI